jgi:hypothetical protein
LLLACSESADATPIDATVEADAASELDAGSAQQHDGALGHTKDATVSTTGDAELDPTQDARPPSASADAGARDATAVAPIVCSVRAPTSCPDPAPRYADVAAVIALRCESCHSPRWHGPWPLDRYEHVADWQDTVRANMLDCSMPPPDAGIAMADAERMVILNWLRCGLPR